MLNMMNRNTMSQPQPVKKPTNTIANAEPKKVSNKDKGKESANKQG